MKSLTDYSFIDIHYHACPDLYLRRLSALGAGHAYQSLNGAVFLKSHLGSTSVQATLAQSVGLPVFPSLVLNPIAGGIDYRVIQHALADYQSDVNVKMIVHFPTITGRSYQSRLARQLAAPYLSEQTLKSDTVFNEQHQLKKEVIDILKMAGDYPIVLSTGHASKEETYELVEKCAQYKVSHLLLNQPANPLTDLKADELKALVDDNKFVWVEQTALTYLLGHQSQEDLASVLTKVPRVIYSSDLGQTNQMDVASWINFSNELFDLLSLSAQRREALLKENAIQLLAS